MGQGQGQKQGEGEGKGEGEGQGLRHEQGLGTIIVFVDDCLMVAIRLLTSIIKRAEDGYCDEVDSHKIARRPEKIAVDSVLEAERHCSDQDPSGH